MKNLGQIKTLLKSSKPEMRKKYNVKNVGIFGSYARGDAKKSSDVDIMVTFNDKASLFDYADLGEYLEKKLKVKVDVVSKRGLRSELKNAILKEIIRI